MNLEWKGYDPDSQLFVFSTTDGSLFAVPLREMQKVVEFVDGESEPMTA